MGCNQSTPVKEPTSSAPASTHSTAQAEVEQAPVSSNKKFFKTNGVSITEQGVVYYYIDSTDGNVSLKKRFTDFKNLYANLSNPADLPPLPEAGMRAYFRGKHNHDLMKEREDQFEVILNAIASNPALVQSDAFRQFLDQQA